MRLYLSVFRLLNEAKEVRKIHPVCRSLARRRNFQSHKPYTRFFSFVGVVLCATRERCFGLEISKRCRASGGHRLNGAAGMRKRSPYDDGTISRAHDPHGAKSSVRNGYAGSPAPFTRLTCGFPAKA